ncbi:MAG: H4MPT-linked C1 transfer pathway protein [Planctomycetes bacterium]|nr:H4MPT-linked C1 transfer pathway protein [Planctomycetota bacterium]
MATPIVLGLDIGGANLKAATHDKRAVSVPFPLWKQPDKLPSALAELVAKFPEVEELAVTMTGELCDCFETKRDGVNAIIAAVRFASGGRRIRVWSTDGVFLTTEEAKRNHLKVAAANWHALATLAGQYVPHGSAVLLDVGSTTTDAIPIMDGFPIPSGRTDPERLSHSELIYTGVRRTPLGAIVRSGFATELFATTHDVYLHLRLIPEDAADLDTADGRPATRVAAFDRLCRMFCGDRETISVAQVDALAERVMDHQLNLIEGALVRARGKIEINLESRGLERTERNPPTVIVAGSGEFLAARVASDDGNCHEVLSLTARLGANVSACAPAYAVAVLATESRS